MSTALSFLFLCIQACLLQNVYSQCLGPAGYGLGYGPGIGMGPGLAPGYGGLAAPGLEPLGAYGGAGVGDVAVAGELPVAGSALVAGQVPVLGAVRFVGELPAAGVVTVTGACACGCASPAPYYY